MISYLNGTIVLKKDNLIILEVQGVGYEVFLAAKSIENLQEVGENVALFSYLDVGERSLKLYGFLAFEELELFKIVRSIQGVGPKAALEISSVGSLEKIKKEMEKGGAKFLDGIPGIGAKKASKIILELSGKIKTTESLPKKEKDSFEQDEAFLALLNLGFSKDQAKKVLLELPEEIKDPQEKVKQALKIAGRQ